MTSPTPGKDYSFPLREAWLVEALEGTSVRHDSVSGDGSLSVRASRQGKDIVVHGRLAAGLIAECARCLADAPLAVDAAVGALLTARSADLRPEPDELELTPEDLEREFFSGDRIELDAMVREQLLLEVPIKPLCDEGCPGIEVPASVAGPANLSEGVVDPRLAPLMKLAGKLEPAEE